MKVFSVAYSNELGLIAMGLVNRQLQLTEVGEKSSNNNGSPSAGLMTRMIYSQQFSEVIVSLSFSLNAVTKKWNLAAVFEDDVLRVFELTKSEREGSRLSSFSLFFVH